MTWPEKRIGSWNELQQLFEQYYISDPLALRFAFRGQASDKWTLDPSLIRPQKVRDLIEKSQHDVEKRLLGIFKARAHTYLPPYVSLSAKECTAWWCVMQHHRAPTRLLDWSLSPYVATYFAVCERLQEDGAVWIFDTQKLKNKVLARFGDQMRLPDNPDECEKFFFNIESIRAIFSAAPIIALDRMIAQQGIFTLSPSVFSDHAELIDELLASSEEKIDHLKVIIPNAIKEETMQRLRPLNIAAHALFPGIDGLGLELKEICELIAGQE